MRAWTAVGLLSLFASFRWALAADSCVHEGVALVGNRFFLLEGCHGQTAEFGMVWKRNGTIMIRFTVQQGDLNDGEFSIEFAKGCKVWIKRNTQDSSKFTAWTPDFTWSKKYGEVMWTIRLSKTEESPYCKMEQMREIVGRKLYSKLTVRVPRAAVGFVMLVTSTDGDLRRLDDEP
ncbi:hypothetical protein M3Y99_00450400 [Aphelenchoides fujianensis]|nr:hypothetical protein M3Y99_00450400 [Aphelenchoides fujianensis]